MIGNKIKATISNIADYGAFVELQKGVEGLIHVSEMSWTKKNVHPNAILNVNDEVNVNNDQLSRNGIKVIYGEASFKNKNEIIIKSGKDTREIKSEFFLRNGKNGNPIR